MTLGFVPDSTCSLQGLLYEVPRLHSELTFRYRPMTAAEAGRYEWQAIALDDVQRVDLAAHCLAEHIQGWDLRSPGGEPVPVTWRSTLRLVPRLFTRLLGIVQGTDVPDELAEVPEILDIRVQVTIDLEEIQRQVRQTLAAQLHEAEQRERDRLETLRESCKRGFASN